LPETVAGFSKIAMIFENICWLAVSHSDDTQNQQVAQTFPKTLQDLGAEVIHELIAGENWRRDNPNRK